MLEQIRKPKAKKGKEGNIPTKKKEIMNIWQEYFK